MRTTITLADDVLDEVRRRAAAQGKTVSQVVEDSVRAALLRQDGTAAPTFTVRGFRGGRTDPRIDLDDNAALLDALDRA